MKFFIAVVIGKLATICVPAASDDVIMMVPDACRTLARNSRRPIPSLVASGSKPFPLSEQMSSKCPLDQTSCIVIKEHCAW
jgi:hypothetical protein